MAKVGIIMGSDSDLDVMSKAAEVLEEFGIDYEMTIISAHRMPDIFYDYATSAESKGMKVIIAGAGGAAHLPGMAAAIFPMPVIGVPIYTKSLGGVDSLYSIVQMPSGIPVATVAINGGQNAGTTARENILAASMYEAQFGGKVTIWNRSDAEENGEFLELGYDTLNEFGEHEQKSIHVYADEVSMASLYVYGDDDARPGLYLGRGANAREVAIKQDVNDAVAPITIVVNSAENAWSIPNPPAPQYTQLANVIDAYRGGRTVLIQYESGGVAGVAVSPPMAVSLDFGILVQAYPNRTLKQYLINMNGSVTVITP